MRTQMDEMSSRLREMIATAPWHNQRPDWEVVLESHRECLPALAADKDMSDDASDSEVSEGLTTHTGSMRSCKREGRRGRALQGRVEMHSTTKASVDCTGRPCWSRLKICTIAASTAASAP